MLTTIAFICLIVGIVCLVAGYTVEPRTIRPGWGLLVVALVVYLLAVFLPALPHS